MVVWEVFLYINMDGSLGGNFGLRACLDLSNFAASFFFKFEPTGNKKSLFCNTKLPFLLSGVYAGIIFFVWGGGVL